MQCIVSGSSSLEITKNSEFLTGRALEFVIERVSFLEFVSYRLNTDIHPLSFQNWPAIEGCIKRLNRPWN